MSRTPTTDPDERTCLDCESTLRPDGTCATCSDPRQGTALIHPARDQEFDGYDGRCENSGTLYHDCTCPDCYDGGDAAQEKRDYAHTLSLTTLDRATEDANLYLEAWHDAIADNARYDDANYLANDVGGICGDCWKCSCTCPRTAPDPEAQEATVTHTPDPVIRCRAKRSARCLHGQPLIAQFGDPEQDTLDCDGTYIAATDSIVCDECYIALGTPLNPVLPNATA